jgi:signal peptidase I
MQEPIETTQVTVEPEPPPGSPRRFVGRLNAWGWLRDLVVSIVIAALIIVFLYQPVKVEGTSMMPWLTDQERIFINKFVYKFEDIQRGDVVVFWYPMDTSKSYIKRVVGLPGEAVKIVNGSVYIDGKLLDEPYVVTDYTDQQSYPVVKVEPEHFYVLGDHRNSSNDSRSWGTVPREYIYGKAVLVYWPVDKFKVLK